MRFALQCSIWAPGFLPEIAHAQTEMADGVTEKEVLIGIVNATDDKVLRQYQNPEEGFKQPSATNPEVVEVIQLASKNKKKWIFVGASNSSGIAMLLTASNAEVMITQVVPSQDDPRFALTKLYRQLD